MLYDAIFALLGWAAFEYVVSETVTTCDYDGAVSTTLRNLSSRPPARASSRLAASLALISSTRRRTPTRASRSGSSTSTFRSPSPPTPASAGAPGRRCAYLDARQRADLESYVAIHQGVIFGALTLLTGSIWARVSWGVWWSWGEDELVLFLVLFLFYCAYFMLRFSVEPGRARANMCAVYALFGVVLIPVSFLAIRLSQKFIHPVVFNTHGPQMTGSQFFTFCVSLAAMLTLFATLYQRRAGG